MSRRLVHLTTVDISLWLLLRTELVCDLAAGYEVYGMSAPGPYVAELEGIGVRHLAVPSLTRSWRPADDIRAIRQVTAALRRLRPDVVHTHTPKAGVVGRVVARAIGTPVVVNTCHGLWLRPGDRWARRAAVIAAETAAAWCSDAELYQNADDEQTLRRLRGRRPAKVVGNGIDLTRFHPDPQAGAAFRAAHGIRDDALVVGTVGRRVAEKGMAEFAATAAQLADRATFVWIGPDDDGASRPERVGAVSYLGMHDDMRAAYAAFDVFVMASHREGFSRSAMEAAACGLPLVLTDIRGCREIGQPGVHAVFTPAGDAIELTRAVEALLDDPARREQLAANARARAAGCFDQRMVARASITTYAEVARRKGRDWP